MRRDYEFGQQLGKGSFGVVFKVRRKADARTFVCKELELKSMGKKAREEANQEVALLRKVSSGSEYIVQYIGSFLEGECLHIVMEFCEHGDLSGYVKMRVGQLIEEKIVWKFLIQIGIGLRWLHKNRILHRDIKTLNVFLTAADDARLGDLGVARVLSHNTNFANTFVGTPYYLSPELCEEKPYNELSDVWAFGCVVYEMCTLKHPFEAKNHAALLIKILRGQFAPVSEKYSAELRTLLDGCMRRDLSKRTKLADVLGSAPVHSWAERLGIALEQPQPGSGGGSAPKSSATSPPQEPGRQAPKPPPARAPGVPAAGAAPGSAAPVGGGGARAPVRNAAPKVQAPARRAAEQAGAPLRARDRRASDRRAGGGLRKPCGEDPRGSTHTLIAAPASRAAVQVVRSAPSRVAGRPVCAVPIAPSRNAPGTPTNGNPASTNGLRRPVSAAEERRRAAREVADLPDVVVPTAPRTGRNVPSVHQLLQLEPEPLSARPMSSCSTSGGAVSPPVRNTTAASAEAFLQQAAAMSMHEDMTMLPDDRTMLPGQEEVVEEVVEEVQEEEEEVQEEEEEEVQEEMQEEAEEQHTRGAAGYPTAGELTLDSVFGTHRRPSEDSLAFTAEDTMASCLQGSVEPGSGVDVVPGWGVAQELEERISEELLEESGAREVSSHLEQDLAGEESSAREVSSHLEEDLAGEESPLSRQSPLPEESFAGEESLQPAAKLDSDGLLCDAQWQLLPSQPELSPLLVEPSVRVSSGPASPVAGEGADGARAGRPGGRRSPSGGRSPASTADRLAAKVERLTSQISRLHADVVKDLDAPARAVWDELYRLFQAKMEVDLTDEDQSEIERYVFEQLPTESTDLIWKVYKVLHLEQERDRCQRLLAG